MHIVCAMFSQSTGSEPSGTVENSFGRFSLLVLSLAIPKKLFSKTTTVQCCERRWRSCHTIFMKSSFCADSMGCLTMRLEYYRHACRRGYVQLGKRTGPPASGSGRSYERNRGGK